MPTISWTGTTKEVKGTIPWGGEIPKPTITLPEPKMIGLFSKETFQEFGRAIEATFSRIKEEPARVLYESLYNIGEGIFMEGTRLLKRVGVPFPEEIPHPVEELLRAIGKEEWIKSSHTLKIGKTYWQEARDIQAIEDDTERAAAALNLGSQVILDISIIGGIAEGWAKGKVAEFPKPEMSEAEARNILGVPKGASERMIKQAYYGEAHLTHPDIVGTGSEEAFEKINDAHQVLTQRRPITIRIADILTKPIFTVEPGVSPIALLPEKIPEVKPEISEIPKFDTEKYKLGLLKEIEEMPELPKIERGVIDWKPPTLAYQNPYTKIAYKAWDEINRIWSSKAPDWLKTFKSKEIEELAREKQRIMDGLTKKYLEEFVRPMEKLSAEEKIKIGKMIFKQMDIPLEYELSIKNIDKHIGQLGKAIVNIDLRMVDEGLLPKDMALLSPEKWAENLGEYMRTLYIRPNPRDPTKFRIIPRSAMTAEGIMDRSAFRQKLTDAEWGANALAFEGEDIEIIKQHSLQELEEIGKIAKEQWGWTTQADYALAKTFRDMSKAYATRLWQEEIVKDPRLFSQTPKEGFISIEKYLPRGTTKDVRLGPLNNGYINPALENEIQLFIRFGRDSVERAMGGPLSLWKGLKVAANPRTVIRNFLSGGLIQTDMAGYPVWNPKNTPKYIQSIKDYLTKKDSYLKARDVGQFGGDYYAVEIEEDELTRLIKKVEKSNNPIMTYGQAIAEKIGKGISTTRGALSYYGHIDHIQRLYLFNSATTDGATSAQAVHFANKWELDYRFVPQLIERARTGIVGWFYPFVSFYQQMTPRILETLITRPWVLAKYPIFVALLGYLTSQILGLDKEQIETAKPQWLKDSPYVIPLPYTDEAGNIAFLDLSYTLPFGSWETGFIDWKDILNQVRGGGMTALHQSILNNYDSYTQTKIYNEIDSEKEKIAKIAAYALRGYGPGFINDAINIYKAAKGEVIGWPYPRERDLTLTTLRALGISTYVGGKNEALGKIRKYQREINDLEFALRRVLQNPNISDKEKTEKALEVREGIQKRMEKIRIISENMPNLPSETPKGGTIPWE